jgi:hypothetical protein
MTCPIAGIAGTLEHGSGKWKPLFEQEHGQNARIEAGADFIEWDRASGG